MSNIRPLANPYFLLTVTTIFWAANTIAGRLAVGQVTPMFLTAVRWMIAFGLIALFYPKVARAAPRLIAERPSYVFVMALIGFTGFNAVYYVAAHYTYAVNLGIMQASTPIFVMLGAALFQRTRISMGQVAGMAAGVVGVLTVASTGKISVLQNLDFNRGDMMVLGISAVYAAYSLGLRYKPAQWDGLALFGAMALMAAVTALPLLAIEIARGQFFWPTPKGWAVIAFVGVFPSLIAQVWYIKGVALVGAARAGFLFNAIPVFAAIMAVAFLGEPVGWHHAVGLALVIGGIAWAERRKG